MGISKITECRQDRGSGYGHPTYTGKMKISCITVNAVTVPVIYEPVANLGADFDWKN